MEYDQQQGIVDVIHLRSKFRWLLWWISCIVTALLKLFDEPNVEIFKAQCIISLLVLFIVISAICVTEI